MGQENQQGHPPENLTLLVAVSVLAFRGVGSSGVSIFPGSS